MADAGEAVRVTARQWLALRAPYYRLLLRANRLLKAERERHAETRLALACAVDQRNHARDVVAAMVEAEGWSESDEAFLRSLGERGPA